MIRLNSPGVSVLDLAMVRLNVGGLGQVGCIDGEFRPCLHRLVGNVLGENGGVVAAVERAVAHAVIDVRQKIPGLVDFLGVVLGSGHRQGDVQNTGGLLEHRLQIGQHFACSASPVALNLLRSACRCPVSRLRATPNAVAKSLGSPGSRSSRTISREIIAVETILVLSGISVDGPGRCQRLVEHPVSCRPRPFLPSCASISRARTISHWIPRPVRVLPAGPRFSLSHSWASWMTTW